MVKSLNTYFKFGNCLFGTVELTKNAGPDKYRYSRYSIGFDSRFKIFMDRWKQGKNVIVFGDDMSSSVHIDNENKDISVLGEGPTQGLDNTTLTSEA